MYRKIFSLITSALTVSFSFWCQFCLCILRFVQVGERREFPSHRTKGLLNDWKVEGKGSQANREQERTNRKRNRIERTEWRLWWCEYILSDLKMSFWLTSICNPTVFRSFKLILQFSSVSPRNWLTFQFYCCTCNPPIAVQGSVTLIFVFHFLTWS